MLDDPLLAELDHRVGRVRGLEQPAGRLVDPLVRGLRRQGDGDEEGEGVAMLELALRLGFARLETAEDLADLRVGELL